MNVECTNSSCSEEATKVLAWEMGASLSSIRSCVYVAPYCDHHADELGRREGAAFACGPALSEDVQPISGVRR